MRRGPPDGSDRGTPRRSGGRNRRGLHLEVQACADDVTFVLEVDDVTGASAAASRDHVNRRRCVAEVVIKIFGPERYVLPERLLDAATDSVPDFGAL
jgi:hypothetical protein